MEEAIYDIRVAMPEDVEQINKNIKRTMVSPEGKAPRKGLRDAAVRRELLVLERYESKERAARISAFIEWHARVDGTVTIKDLGTAGDEPHTGMIKRIVRELLHESSPPEARVKLRADLIAWNSIFQDLPGFYLEGQEFSRPHWKNIWTWTPEAERRARGPRERGERRR
ncbi:MAG: hypothetical protein HY675_10375 [Chloroflexi bacterium]|nr:hypothetical protein [Chloroflexota bacterium]